jgi:hypothetical protein
MVRSLLALLVASAALLAGCSAATTPTPAPTPAGTVVTIRVHDETYRVRLTDPADVAVARDLLAGKEGPRIPNGRIVRGDPDVNTGYSWHIDPGDFEWVEVTIELCDGLPSYVEDGSLSGDRFCPWAAEVVAVEGD